MGGVWIKKNPGPPWEIVMLLLAQGALEEREGEEGDTGLGVDKNYCAAR